MEQDWILQKKETRRLFSNATWIPLRASTNNKKGDIQNIDYTSDYFGCGSVAFPPVAEEFDIANALIKARSQANMTQADVAEQMNTTQSVIARLEGGGNPSIKMLKRYAAATGTKLKIDLQPAS